MGMTGRVKESVYVNVHYQKLRKDNFERWAPMRGKYTLQAEQISVGALNPLH
jgi:hypothetical protein